MATDGNNQVAQRYAQALYALCVDKKAVDAVHGDMATVIGALDASDDLVIALDGPIANTDEKIAVVGALCDTIKSHKISKNFLQLLATKRRLTVLRAIVDAFNILVIAGRGQVTATVTTATELTAKNIKAIEDVLHKQLNAKVVVEPKVDESIIGGLIVQVGDRMVDSSVSTKLQKLKLAMKE